jgi:hypothetical protein
MENILKKWKTTTCTFTITEDWQTFNWILYVDGKKMRYTSKWTIAWKTFETNVITKEWFSYSWTNMDVKWFKMKDTQWEDNNDEDVGAEERVQEMDFDCKKWVENWTFELPSAIEFSEFTIPVAK